MLEFCDVLVVVGMDAELDESSVDDVSRCEDVIVSQWREVSADVKNQLRERCDEILHPLGLETRMVVIRRANSTALYLICMTLSAIMSLRDQWRKGQLRDIVQSLFTLLSGATRPVRVKRLTWTLDDYEQSLGFFHYAQGKVIRWRNG